MNAVPAATALARIEERGADPTWITRLPPREVLACAASAQLAPRTPLTGATFAIKDNIDLAGIPTTAACPDFAYTPANSATVVQRLLEAGAIPIGKTNLDQFATGLVGVRSPYGVPRNPFHADYIPGGSSSGSAVAVAAGLCDFALGTDTAGSGRIPAAFNNLVGLKPTRGLLSTRGVVPACRTLDCVSVFAKTVNTAARVLAVTAAFDQEDPYSRAANPPLTSTPAIPRVGVPREDQLEFFGNTAAQALFAAAIARWRCFGATVVEIDYAPFLETARLLYEGPWVAERYAAIRPFIERTPQSLHPVTRMIIEGARDMGAVASFEGMYRLAALERRCAMVWNDIDMLLTPTAGTIYTVAEVIADPVRLNSNLGRYTNYMNLLDLCGLAVPAGFLPNGLPWGVTFAAPAFHDDRLICWGARFLDEPAQAPAITPSEPMTRVVVCGAHLSGLPLNHQLTERGATLVKATTTSPQYRLFALSGTTPPKPGLVRVNTAGAAIEVEVWEMPIRTFGSFVAQIPTPLGIGSINLADGTQAHGFVCEHWATAAACDITEHGGWRAAIAAQRTQI